MKRSLFPKIKVFKSVHHQSWVCKEAQRRRVHKITSASTSFAFHFIAFGNGFFRRPPWRSLRVQVHPCRTRTGTMEFHGSGAPNLHGHNLQARRTSRISETVREKVSWFFLSFTLLLGAFMCTQQDNRMGIYSGLKTGYLFTFTLFFIFYHQKHNSTRSNS